MPSPAGESFNEAPPPSYDNVVGESSDLPPEKSIRSASDDKTPTPKSSAQASSSGYLSSKKDVFPREVLCIPRRARESESVRVTLTPDSSRIIVTSVDSLEVYCSNEGTLFWRITSDASNMASDGLPCKFDDVKGFSTDSSLLFLLIRSGNVEELVVLNVSDGHVLGKRFVTAEQCLSVCMSPTNRRVARAGVASDGAEFGRVELGNFNPDAENGQGFPPSAQITPMPKDDKPKPVISSCFSPDGEHLFIAAEVIKPIDNKPGSIYRNRLINFCIYETKPGAKRVRSQIMPPEQVFKQVPFEPQFLFPRNEQTGKHRWLVAYNGPEKNGKNTFAVLDIMREEVVTIIKEEFEMPMTRFLGTLVKTTVWSRIRFAEDVEGYVHVVRKGKTGTGKICVTRGRVNLDGSARSGKKTAEGQTAVIEVGAQDNWQVSKDGRMGVGHIREKGSVVIWRL